jgi:hypothetical protein
MPSLDLAAALVRRQALKLALTSLITSMPVTNTDGIIGVANTLSSITSNPYELGVDAVALASNKSLELTNTLLNFGPTTQLKTLNQASTLIMDNMASSMIVIFFLIFFLNFI